jgi:hypothetical protein
MFRRKSAELVAEPDPEVTEEAAVPARKAYTPKKGEATPRRVDPGRRVVAAAPTNRREANARSKEKQRQNRKEQREGMMAGDERFLSARDRGPVRGLIRDTVDARRNVGPLFIVVAFAILLFSNSAMPGAVRQGANAFFLFGLLALLVDTALLFRLVRKRVKERIPDATDSWGGLYFYTFMRAISFRRIRIPRPRVKVGDKI